MDPVVTDRLLPALREELDSHFLGAHSVPPFADGYFLSHRFQPTLLLLFSDNFSVHAAREVVINLDVDWDQVLEAPPLVFTPRRLQRYAQLFPILAYFLTNHATSLCGEALPLDSLQKPHPVERLAFLIDESIGASAALVPEKAEAQSLARLRRLAAQLSGKETSESETANDLFARVHVYLRHFLDSMPIMSGHRLPVVRSADEPNLLAFYEDQQRLLVVIPPLSANLLSQIDWSPLAGPMPSHLTTLNVATADQLYLTIQTLRPLDFLLASYRRQWGADLLKGLKVSARAVFRQAARKSSALLVDGVYGAYLLSHGEEGVHRVIHDFQNRLLNIRLEAELLCRLLQTPLAEPSDPLPRRDEPLTARIDAIVAHLDWWTDHYFQEMLARPADQKLAPT